MKNKYKKKKETHLLLDKTCQINAKKMPLTSNENFFYLYTKQNYWMKYYIVCWFLEMQLQAMLQYVLLIFSKKRIPMASVISCYSSKIGLTSRFLPSQMSVALI